jgi:hypothetical protein
MDQRPEATVSREGNIPDFLFWFVVLTLGDESSVLQEACRSQYFGNRAERQGRKRVAAAAWQRRRHSQEAAVKKIAARGRILEFQY